MSLLALIASHAAGTVDPPPPDPDPTWPEGLLHPGVTATRVGGSGGPLTTEVAMSEDITKVGDTYWLLYTNQSGGITRLHLSSSTSPDGPWTTHPGNPILTTGSGGPNPLAWESQYTNGGSIILHAGSFYLYYCDDLDGGAISVATATAITGPYIKHGSILVDVDPDPAAWDSRRVQEPHVIIAPDGTWVMTYMAEKAGTPVGSSEQNGIATAPGPLGPWTKSPSNPVLPYGPDGAWDGGGTADPSLFYEPETQKYWMLYSGLAEPMGGWPWQLGLAYASSVHGPWTRLPDPILSPVVGQWDSTSVWRGAIFKESGIYHLPYGGFDSNGPGQAKGGAARIDVD